MIPCADGTIPGRPELAEFEGAEQPYPVADVIQHVQLPLMCAAALRMADVLLAQTPNAHLRRPLADHVPGQVPLANSVLTVRTQRV